MFTINLKNFSSNMHRRLELLIIMKIKNLLSNK
jgi:hypothetical protein